MNISFTPSALATFVNGIRDKMGCNCNLVLATLTRIEDKIMASEAELMAKIGELNDAVVAEKQEVVDAVAALEVEIQNLKDQIAAGSGVPQEALDAVDAAIANVKGIFTSASEEVPIDETAVE